MAAAVALSGCAGYRLGPTNGVEAREKTVQVRPFANTTLQPRLGDAVTQQLRQEIQRDGTYQITSRDDGDIVVSGVITGYNRREISFAPNDVQIGRAHV